MDAKHPKRKKDPQNPYTLVRTESEYYVVFRDVHNNEQRIPVTREIYEMFNAFELEDIAQMNKQSRHHEHSQLTEQKLTERALRQEVLPEDIVYQKSCEQTLQAALDSLPIQQRRRVLLYYFYSMTYAQIAAIEGCTIMPVKRSIDRALRKMKLFFEEGG